MSVERFLQVLCDVFGKRLELGNASILLAASPIIKTPATNPYRIVLRLVMQPKPEFVIHNQMWVDRYFLPDGSLDVQAAGPQENHRTGYDQGQYYPLDQFHIAYQKWAERCLRDALDHASTIYREMDKQGVPASSLPGDKAGTGLAGEVA